MSPAPRATPVPVSRIVLRRVVQGAAAPRPPVFHVFEELYERARQGASRDVPQVGRNGRAG